MLSIIQKRIFLNTRRNICHQHHRFGLPKHFLQPFGAVIIGVLRPNLITYKNPCYNICPFSHSSRIFSFYSLPEGIPVSIFATASVQKNTFSHDRQQGKSIISFCADIRSALRILILYQRGGGKWVRGSEQHRFPNKSLRLDLLRN